LKQNRSNANFYYLVDSNHVNSNPKIRVFWSALLYWFCDVYLHRIFTVVFGIFKSWVWIWRVLKNAAACWFINL